MLHCLSMPNEQSDQLFALASMQSDQSLRCPHEETLHPWLVKMHRENFDQTAQRLCCDAGHVVTKEA